MNSSPRSGIGAGPGATVSDPPPEESKRDPLRHTGHGSFDTALYVPRPAEESEVETALARDHALVLIAPARLGKTWLFYQLRATVLQGWNVIDVNLTLTRRERREGTAAVLYGIGTKIGEKAQIGPGVLRSIFLRSGTPAEQLADLFKRHILTDPRPFLLVLDRADDVAEVKEVAALFFTLIRNWASQARYNPNGPWSRFHVAAILRGPAPTYLNLGKPVDLKEITVDQAVDLLRRIGGDAARVTPAEVARLWEIIGGQPHLWRLAGNALRDGTPVGTLLDVTPDNMDQGVFGPHLFWLRERLATEPSRPAPASPRVLKDVANDLLVGRRIDDEEVLALSRFGLVVSDESSVSFRCGLYRMLAEQVCRGR